VNRFSNRVRCACAAAIFGLSTAFSAPVAVADSLADALIGAYRTSDLLEQNRALLRATDENVGLAMSNLRPILNYALRQQHTRNATSTSGVSNATSAEITATMLLWDNGATRLSVEAAKESVLATRAALLDLEQSVLLNAVIGFSQVRSTAEVVALRQNNVRLITEQLRAAKDRFEVGEVTRTDVALAEARLAEARAGLVAAEGDFATSRELYKSIVGRFPDNLVTPGSFPATANSLQEAKAVAQRRHPSIIQAQHVVRANELNTDATQKAIFPTLSANATVSRNSSNSNLTTSSLGVALTGPIYSGGRISAQYRQVVQQTEASRAALRDQVNSVELAVADAWFQVQVAQARIEASERQIRSATVAFRGVTEEASLGARTTLDVLNAEQDLLDARTARVTAAADHLRATYTLLQSMGLLTVEHLKLGIPTYDASVYFNAVSDAPPTSTRGARLDKVLQSIGQN